MLYKQVLCASSTITLAEAKLVPAAVIRFGSEGPSIKLKDSLLATLSEFEDVRPEPRLVAQPVPALDVTPPVFGSGATAKKRGGSGGAQFLRLCKKFLRPFSTLVPHSILSHLNS